MKTKQDNSTGSIGDKLILVRLKTHAWSARKFDKKASNEVAKLAGKEDATDIGRFNKTLIEKDAIEPVRTARNELYNRHKFMTAPWTDDGVRVLTSELYFEYTKTIREATAQYNHEVTRFVDVVYPAARDAAKTRLGPLYREQDYPTIEELRHSLRAPEVHFEPLPNPEDVRVWGVGEVAAREIERDVRNSVQEAIDAAHAHVAGALITRAQEFVDKVRRYDKHESRTLYETAIENLRDVINLVLSGLNVKQDAALADMARQLEIALRDVSIEDLRGVEKKEKTLRKTKTAEVDRIAGKFAGVFGPAVAAGGAR